MTLKPKPKMVLLEGKILDVSSEFAKRIGYAAENLVGEDINTIVPENFRHFAEESLKKGGKIVLIGADGRLHELEVVFDGEKTLLVDFNEIKDVIREAYSILWDFHYGFIFVDEFGEIITCNDTFYRFMNLKPEEIEGKKIWEVFGDWCKDVLNKVLSGKDSLDLEFRYKGRIWRSRAKFRIFDVYGKKIIEALVRTVEEERIRNLEKTFGRLSYPVVVAESGKVIYQNEKALEIFGNRVGDTWTVLEDKDVQHVKLDTLKGSGDYVVFRMKAKEEIYLFFDFSEYTKIVEELEKELLSYKEMVEKSIDTILIIDNFANILFVNQAIRAYGYEPEEVVGRKFTEYLPPEEAKSILKEYENFLRTGDFRRREVQVFTKGGEVRWVDVLGRGIRDESGRIVQAIAIVRDVTERKRMMEELWRSRELYRSFFELSPDFVGVVDVTGKLLYVNRQFLAETGKSIEEIRGMNILDFVHEEDKKKGVEVFRRALESGETVREILRTVVSGKIKTLDVAVKFIYDEKPLYALIVSRDISDRIELEKALREREELYRTLTENSLAAIFVIQDDKIVYCNKVFEMLTGYTREEWEKMDAYACFRGEIAKRAKETVRKALNGKIVATTAKYVTKDGEVRYADFIMAPIEYKGRRAVIGNAVDITERKRAEIKLREREELYRTLTESSHTGIFIINKDEKIVYANPKLFEMFGYGEEELRKFKHPYDVVLPEFREITIDRLRRRLRGEEVPESYEIKVRTREGDKWLKVLASRITYKKEPAVLVNLADITDLKRTEEKLLKLNLLLSAVNQINRVVSFEKSDKKLLKKVREILENLNVKVLILSNLKGKLQVFDASEGVDDLAAITKIAEDYCSTCDGISILQISKNGKWIVISPLSAESKLYGAIVLVSENPLESYALEMMETLARDIAFALKAIEMERDREMAIKVVLSNLDQFEELADKLRNPLAIIKGYIEVRNEFEHEELIRKIEEQADRIESILDELRVREFITYDLKKMLEGKR